MRLLALRAVGHGNASPWSYVLRTVTQPGFGYISTGHQCVVRRQRQLNERSGIPKKFLLADEVGRVSRLAAMHLLLQLSMLLLCLSLMQTRAEISEDMCLNQLNGVINGGSCFFTLNTSGTWDQAWSLCEAQDATLAQIHTSSEYADVTAMLTKIYGGFQFWTTWIAMKRDSSDPGTTCAVGNDTTYWYSSQSTKMTKAGDTWMRTHSCEDFNNGMNEFWISIYIGNPPMIADLPIDGYQNRSFSLCQAKACQRKYATAPSCITEPPIETLATAVSIQECADACSDRLWCHSFNLIMNNNDCNKNQCQLYSWVSTETCPGCPLTGSVSDCVHYDVEA